MSVTRLNARRCHAGSRRTAQLASAHTEALRSLRIGENQPVVPAGAANCGARRTAKYTRPPVAIHRFGRHPPPHIHSESFRTQQLELTLGTAAVISERS